MWMGLKGSMWFGREVMFHPLMQEYRSRQADLEASSHADGLVRKRGAFRIFELGPAGLVQVSASGTPLPVFI